MLFERLIAVLARLNALAGVDGEWEDAKVALIKLVDEPFVPNANMTYAQFALAEANFSGYARSAAVTWGPAFADANKRGVIMGDSKQFTANAATVGNIVTGYAMLDAAGTGLLWAELFTAPKTVDESGDAIIVIPKYIHGRMLPPE